MALSSLKEKQRMAVNTVMNDNNTIRFITRQEIDCQLVPFSLWSPRTDKWQCNGLLD